MRRLYGLVLVVGLLIAGTTTAHAEEATPEQWQNFASDLADLEDAVAAAEATLAVAAPIQGWRWDECRFNSLDRPLWTPREERLTAACLVEKWSVPGGLAQLTSTIQCESGWYRKAYNPAGPYVGLGQHVLSAWDDRLRTYTPQGWELRDRWQNSRAMLTVTVRMMHGSGTGAWSCA